MRLPRDISGVELAKRMEKYGYRITRQTGSHMRLTTQSNGEHHITIPNRKELRVGTLHAILKDVADHLGLDHEVLLIAMFGS